MYLFIYFLIICRYNVKTASINDNTQDNLINISTSPSIFASTSYSAKINNFDELYEQAQNIVTVNGNYAKLYQKIIDAFFKKYKHTIDRCCDTKTYLMFIIPADYKPDDIKLLCDQVKKEFFATVTMNDNNEMEFYDCFINLFIETATFALNTIEKVIKLYNHHKHNNDETRKALEANSQLFYDYVISINWADYFYNADIKLCHLYNVYFFEGYKQRCGNHIFAYSYYYNEVFSEHPEYFDNMIECLQKYYKENDFTSQQKMYENEKPDKIREWVSKQEDIQSKEMIYKYLNEVMKIIWLERSRRTKITYLARPLYYKNSKQEQIYELKPEQQEFMTKLKLDSIVENIYSLKFYTLRMCTVDSISNTYGLITNINKNIQRLLAMTIETKQYLFEHIKKKTKLVVNAHYDEQERNENNTEKEISEQKNDILNRITAKINELQMSNIRVKDHYKTLPLVHGQ
ncbi:hypothetical protein BDAP_000964 [Binucleata daphniae]